MADDDPTLARLDSLIDQGKAIKVESHSERVYNDWMNTSHVNQWTTIDGEAYQRWRTSCLAILATLIPEDSVHRDVVTYFKSTLRPSEDARNALVVQLKAIRDVYADGHLKAIAAEPSTAPLVAIRQLCLRFHSVARQLRSRRMETITKGAKKGEKQPRPTLQVNDEYDAQDLMHALLKIYFDDIRPEDPASRFAGAPSRTDFVLGGHGIILELKRTRPGLSDKEVGEQLIIDADRYRTHPECKTLVCFVYDPEGMIANPVELETSLTRVRDGLPVEVMIYPKH